MTYGTDRQTDRVFPNDLFDLGFLNSGKKRPGLVEFSAQFPNWRKFGKKVMMKCLLSFKRGLVIFLKYQKPKMK